MKLLLDTADLNDIEYFCKNFPIAGVTTNPTILAREGDDPLKRLKDIRAIIGEEMELHFQLTEDGYEGMLKEARAVAAYVGGNVFVKVPATELGLAVMKKLAEEGYKITATAMFSASQALAAANAGAAYVVPYVSRIENTGFSASQVVSEMQEFLDAGGFDSEILAASFKTARQVVEAALAGAAAATAGSDILRKLISNPATEVSVKGFSDDWKKAFGDRTLLGMLGK